MAEPGLELCPGASQLQPGPPSQQLSEAQSCSWVWVELVSHGEPALLFLVPLPEPLVFCSDDTPHVPDERLSEAAVLRIVKQLTQLIREAFPGKIVPWVPTMFPDTQAVPGTAGGKQHPSAKE